MAAFGVTAQPTACRLLAYDPAHGLTFESLEPYADHKVDYFYTTALADTLKLDVDDCPHDPNKVRIFADFLTFSHETKTLALLLDPHATVADMLRELTASFGLPDGARLAVYKRCPVPAMHSIESLSREDCLEKSLSEVGLTHDSRIHVEEVIPPLKRPRWPELLYKQTDRRLLRYNDPLGSDDQFCKRILVDKAEKLSSVKTRIAEAEELSADGLVLKKHCCDGEEVRDLDRTVEESSLVSGSCLHVAPGVPAAPGSIRLLLDLAAPAKPEEDEPWYSFTPLCTMVVSTSDTIATLRQLVADRISIILGIDVPVEQISLRERYGDRPGKALGDKQRLDSGGRAARKRLSVHVQHEGYTGRNTVPVSFRVWDPASYALSSPVDVAVNRTTRGRELARVLSAAAKLPAIAVSRVTFPHSFSRLDLWKDSWHCVDTQEKLISDFPLFIGTFGAFVVVRDAEAVMRPPSQEDCQRFERRVATKKRTGINEKSVKIRVRCDSKSP